MSKGSGKGQQLSLPCGKGGTPLGYRLLITVRQLLDKMRSIHILRGLFHIIKCNVFIMQPDIVLHISLEDKHILLHLTDGAPQLLLAEPADIHSVNVDISFLYVIISPDQIQD